MDFTGRKLDWAFDPLQALQRWPADMPVRMLHSGRPHERWARWSILARPVGAFSFRETDTQSVRPRGRSEWTDRGAPCPVRTLRNRPMSDLRALLAATPGAIWLGAVGYDLARWIERLPSEAACDRQWPVIDIGLCPGWLVYDNAAQRWSACGTWRDDLPIDLGAMQPKRGAFEAGDLQAMFDRAHYERTVQRVKDYIAAGDVFQVNLAQRMTAHLQGPWPLAQRAVFEQLATVSPAWYGAYMEMPGSEINRAIASTSPELFLEMNESGHVITRPIKGTRPASTDAAELRNSEKDAAELNMIVDLLRNDLGRVCAYGSVKVTQPRTIESHPTVHHGVATIEGDLHAACDVADLLRATMPGGSITGAPKVRAMQIIDELEPVRRNLYCGAIGLLSERRCCLNIAIRTMLMEVQQDAGRVDFSVGGGIVADSEPASEYDETLDKAAAILGALGLAGCETAKGGGGEDRRRPRG